ncbi:sugar transferase [Larkinella sp.]|uniref:sugar transferase n=1 Tax=Larkinella sp. TaxID=2034517 RepID=UPI003BA861EC
MKHKLAPIILFVYNRLWHLQKTIESLQQCKLAENSDLYIFADGPRNKKDIGKVLKVQEYIKQIEGFNIVHIHIEERNIGLANSVIKGVSKIIQRYKNAIILEDDLIVTNDFLIVMNDALSIYKNHSSIFSISGYMIPIEIPENFMDDAILLPRASSWGWATWLDRWNKADWEMKDYPIFIKEKMLQNNFAKSGRDLNYMLIKQHKGLIDSWAVRWNYTLFKHQAYCLFLTKSKVRNIGNDSSGTHSPSTNRYNVQLNNDSITLPYFPKKNDIALKKLQVFYEPSIFRKIINYFLL